REAGGFRLVGRVHGTGRHRSVPYGEEERAVVPLRGGGETAVRATPRCRGYSQDTYGWSSAKPTNATTSMSACPTTRGHSRWVRCHAQPYTRPITMLPRKPPNPW